MDSLDKLEDLRARLSDLEEIVAVLSATPDCVRCRTPAPPPPRWPGDLWAVDRRPPHTCNRSWRSHSSRTPQ